MAAPSLLSKPPRLFISYSHDSRAHEDRILVLANRLREDGIDARIDQFDPPSPDGWPMWMDREIREADFVAMVCTETYLRRVERREEPGIGRGVLWEAKLIYNILYFDNSEVQRFIPLLLEGARLTSVPLPIRGLHHYVIDTEDGYVGFCRHLHGDPSPEKQPMRKLIALPTLVPQSYPASLDAPDSARVSRHWQYRNRRHTIQRVRLDWIDGVLKQSLYQVARLELGLLANPDAVHQPLKTVVRVPGRPEYAVPSGVSIAKVFEDHAQALLILGAPGTGKTTLLLELASDMLDRAEEDPAAGIPMVFNLSSWAVRRQPLDRWLVSEMNERADVPQRLAQQWIANDEVIPLLDGLDEVNVEVRPACVEAINDFRRGHGLMPIAVCSRTADYESLGVKLRLRNAVVVQPLTRDDVVLYLDRVGEPLRSLRNSVETDSSLAELLETPLMLWVATLAYRGAAVDRIACSSLDYQRTQLFTHFVEAMLERRPATALYPPERVIAWLRWLASVLKRTNQTIFYLEDLDESFLPTAPLKWIGRIGTIAVIGLAADASVVAIQIFDGTMHSSKLILVLFYGLFYGLTFGIPTILLKLRPTEALALGRIRNFRGAISGARIGSLVGAACGIAFAIAFEIYSTVQGQTPSAWPREMVDSLSYALGVLVEVFIVLFVCELLFVLSGIPIGAVIGLFSSISSEAVETRVLPNQGTHRSIKTALTAALIVGLTFVLISRTAGNPQSSLGLGLSAALFAGLILGGMFSIRHFVFRTVLWLNELSPLRSIRFLDNAVERLFLRRVGGGYFFLHRLLLDYFAAMPQTDAQAEPAAAETRIEAAEETTVDSLEVADPEAANVREEVVTATERPDPGPVTKKRERFTPAAAPREKRLPIRRVLTAGGMALAGGTAVVFLLLVIPATRPGVLNLAGVVCDVSSPSGRPEAVRFFERAAAAGNIYAMGNLGRSYSQGRGVTRDLKRAAEWYSRAAASGNIWAMDHLGQIYEKGQGVERDDQKAFRWFVKAANGGNGSASFDVAYAYDSGIGIAPDYGKAREWYLKSAAQGNTSAMGNLGNIYHNGLGVPQDYQNARQWYEKGASGGDAYSMDRLGDLYYGGHGVDRNYVNAREWYERGAKGGNAWAMYSLGYLYEYGQGGKQDYQQAREWYQKSATAGNAAAMCNLGYLYDKAEGVNQDYSTAFWWYTKGALAGNVPAMNLLGSMYDAGHGVKQDYKMARSYYESAASKGNEYAMYNLGVLFEKGHGVTADLAKAREWYTKAAAAGSSGARSRLEELSKKLH